MGGLHSGLPIRIIQNVSTASDSAFTLPPSCTKPGTHPAQCGTEGTLAGVERLSPGFQASCCFTPPQPSGASQEGSRIQEPFADQPRGSHTAIPPLRLVFSPCISAPSHLDLSTCTLFHSPRKLQAVSPWREVEK